jgi:hypothetical protein
VTSLVAVGNINASTTKKTVHSKRVGIRNKNAEVLIRNTPSYLVSETRGLQTTVGNVLD